MPTLKSTVSGEIARSFQRQCKDWLCTGYFGLIRFVAEKSSGQPRILFATILLQPTPIPLHSFDLDTEHLSAAQIVLQNITRKNAVEIISFALKGSILIDSTALDLVGTERFELYVEPESNEQWQRTLHVRTDRPKNTSLDSKTISLINDQLRQNDIPFDGLPDLLNWLQFDPSAVSSPSSSIELTVFPPAAIAFSENGVSKGLLDVDFHLHPNLATKLVTVGVHQFPGPIGRTRIRATEHITWQKPDRNVRLGNLKLQVPDADRALVMLSVGRKTAQRQRFGDQSKAVNKRLLAAQFFDKGLSGLRQTLLSAQPSESRKFEQAVSLLLFILGFNSANPLQSDAPDVLAVTPFGRMIVIECTLKISDFNNKLGKLFERQRALSEALKNGNHDAQVHSFLVCGNSREQIISEEKLLNEHRVGLICREQLEQALSNIHHPPTPDKMLNDYLSATFGISKN